MIFDDFSWFSASGLALRRVTTLTVHRYRGGRDVWRTRGTSGGLQDAPRMPGNPPETKIKILKILFFHIFQDFRLWGLPARLDHWQSCMASRPARRAQGRHPDHRVARHASRQARWVTGGRGIDRGGPGDRQGRPWRPFQKFSFFKFLTMKLVPAWWIQTSPR